MVMNVLNWLIICFLFAGVDPFLGEWHGESKCVAKNTACHDETVVYHVTKAKSGYALVSADKIVDGAPVNMGTLEFRSEGDDLICEYPQGVWRIKIEGGKIDGTLTRSDGSVFRRVKLRK